MHTPKKDFVGFLQTFRIIASFFKGYLPNIWFFVLLLVSETSISFFSAFTPLASQNNNADALAAKIQAVATDSGDPLIGYSYLSHQTFDYRIPDIPFSYVKELESQSDDVVTYKVYDNLAIGSPQSRFSISDAENPVLFCDTTVSDDDTRVTDTYSEVSLLAGEFSYYPGSFDIYIESDYANKLLGYTGTPTDYKTLVGSALDVSCKAGLTQYNYSFQSAEFLILLQTPYRICLKFIATVF